MLEPWKRRECSVATSTKPAHWKSSARSCFPMKSAQPSCRSWGTLPPALLSKRSRIGKNSIPIPRSAFTFCILTYLPSGAFVPPTAAPPAVGKKTSDDHEILFQHWFKSVGPRTYAAQLKKAGNGNHYLVLTEGRRDDKT